MAEFWETAFTEKGLMWGREPARSAVLAAEAFARAGARRVLVPGIGYGRNALPFLERGLEVTGIEISGAAIDLARSKLGLQVPIHHGSVLDMPFDDLAYDGIFSFALLHLLDAPGRAKLVRECFAQLAPGGQMVFTVVTKAAPMYGRGTRLADDWYETLPGVRLYFYDAAAIERELGPYGLVEQSEIDEPTPGGASLPFIQATCRRA
jgi:SAM-dependent methyltransferase